MIVDKFAWGLDVRFAFLHFLSFILFVQQRVSSLHFDGTCFVSWVCLYFMLAFPFLYLLLLNVKKWLEKLCVGREGEEERIRPGENKKTRCFQFFNIHIQNSLFLYISIVDDKSYNIFFLKTQKNVHLCALIFVFVMICLDTVHGCKSEQSGSISLHASLKFLRVRCPWPTDWLTFKCCPCCLSHLSRF